MTRHCLIVVVSLMCSLPIVAAEDKTAVIVGGSAKIRIHRHRSKLLLDARETATAFGWEAKIATPGKLLTLCREGNKGACIPVQLTRVASTTIDDRLFVEATALGSSLRFTIEDRGGRVTLRREKNSNTAAISAYNDAWGKTRGFRAGQTLPDIPLYDMQGREVRFSKFLGKQYIVYCWASW